MLYCVNPESEEPIMLINKHIGFDSDRTDKDGNIENGEGQGIDGVQFQRELLYLDSMGKKRIQIWINSEGGSVMEGYNIFSTILKTKTPCDTYAVGGVASIAAVIFQAGRKRVMLDYAWLMYHNPFGSEDKGLMKTIKQSIVKMICSKSNMSEVDCVKMLDRTSFIDADESRKLNLCDQIDNSKEENTKYLRSIAQTSNFIHECNKVLNTLLPTIKTVNMSFIKVTMKLGLNDSAPEDSILKAIEAIENRAVKAEAEINHVQNAAKAEKVKAEDEMDKLRSKLAKLEADKKAVDEEVEDCKSKLEAFQKDKEKAEAEAKVTEAKNMVEGFAKVGRIKNEEATKLTWVNTALKIGIEDTKNMIESLPINKVAPDVSRALNSVDVPTTAVNLAAKLRAERTNK